jgi:hypothetical protein
MDRLLSFIDQLKEASPEIWSFILSAGAFLGRILAALRINDQISGEASLSWSINESNLSIISVHVGLESGTAAFGIRKIEIFSESTKVILH